MEHQNTIDESECVRRKKTHGNKNHLQKNKSAEKNESESDSETEKYPGDAPIDPKKIRKYSRRVTKKQIQAKDLKGSSFTAYKDFKQKNAQYDFANKLAARSERLLTEQAGFLEADEGEHTCEFTQKEISKEVDISSATKYFELELKQFGPYRMNYTRNGRYLLLGGAKGHVAAIDWQTKKLMCELNVMESCYDVKWLHVETMFAVAQKQWVYIYDNQGLELHCLKGFHNVLRMEFLPYHFLLVGASSRGFLRWIDTSIGKDVAGFHTNMGRLDVMTQNPKNAIVHLGHSNGSVSLWSPNVKAPLVKMLCHTGGAVRSIAIDNTGNYMATSGIDRKLKIWDLRRYQELSSCNIGHGAASLNFSQTGLLSSAIGNIVEVYKDPRVEPISSVYLRHRCPRPVQNVQFCPFEDVLGVSHNEGFSSLLVPGAGEANYDALEANPYQTKKQRQNAEVKMLLDKIQPDMITIDTAVLGQVNAKTAEEEYQKQVDAHLIKPRRVAFPDKRKVNVTKKSMKTLRSKQASRNEALREKTVQTVRAKQKEERQKSKNHLRDLQSLQSADEPSKKKKSKKTVYTGVLSRFKEPIQ